MQIIGDTGCGKSAMLFQVLRQVRGRGDSAIVYDPAREFVKRFYDPRRGDVILNPLDNVVHIAGSRGAAQPLRGESPGRVSLPTAAGS
jgi:type IV secretion system coupling TraD/TrwB family protein